jgi:chemotaxis protein methyltransferase CheR
VSMPASNTMKPSAIDPPQRLSDFDIELRLLLEAIYLKYQHDFRHYAMSSLRRRLAQALDEFNLQTLSQLQDRIMRDANDFSRLFQYLTVQVSDMFRDPSYFRALREHVLPRLRTYPSIKVWVAGCSTGEELWSLKILFDEEGLTERTLFYATDINPDALARAEAGIYALERIQGFTQNYLAAGGTRSLSDYYHAAYGGARFAGSLKERVVFADHSLSTDEVAGSRAGAVRERAGAARLSRSGQQGKPAVFASLPGVRRVSRGRTHLPEALTRSRCHARPLKPPSLSPPTRRALTSSS